ncbi:Ankyrin repeat and MYND domain-containing protein 2 [Elasticomyces elasticus]|nr:Ankyrin repeat and MYND domain-containing protein 2 [Elasticomyces elasticus]
MVSSDSTDSVRQVCNVCGNTSDVLLKCDRCKHNNYCSKQCQAKDLPVHKLYCKDLSHPHLAPGSMQQEVMPPGMTVMGVQWPAISIYVTRDLPQHGIDGPVVSFAGTFMMDSDPKDPRHMELPITSAIDFPLKTYPGEQDGRQVPNVRAARLFIDIDPNSAGFGRPTKVPMGSILVCRRDGRHIKVMEIVALMECLLAMSMALDQQMKEVEMAGKKVNRAVLGKVFFSAAAFAKFFEKLKKYHIEAGHKDWDFECPVEVRGKEEKEKQEGTA